MADWFELMEYADAQDNFNPKMKRWARNGERLAKENPLD